MPSPARRSGRAVPELRRQLASLPRARRALETFFSELPEEDACLAVWLVPLDDRLVPRALALQRRLPALDWLRPLPGHFLHVTVRSLGFLEDVRSAPELLTRGRDALRGVPPFRLSFARVNCFPTAVFAEVEGAAIREAAERVRPPGDLRPFLPHLSLAYVTAPGPPGAIRDAVAAMRGASIGEQEVDEIALCLVPASKRTFLEPWTVVGTAPLG